MTDLDLLHFEQLKSEVQAKYIKNYSPSFDDISKWKGIDIIYFQEDLRKVAKGNISEKSFYTYFKNSPVTKLPRIDMLNILSVYAGYDTWYCFKKDHLFANEILKDNGESEKINDDDLEQNSVNENENENDLVREILKNTYLETNETTVLQNKKTDNQIGEKNIEDKTIYPNSLFSYIKKYLWIGITLLLLVLVALLGFKDEIFSRKYYYSFIDADRNAKINADLQVQILKDDESPILYVAKPNVPFVYTTKSKTLTMVVSSPFYKTDTIRRNLETAPEAENIELKPNDYAFMLFYYSKSLKDLKKKRESLNYLISDNVLIYQVYDNETYGVETMDKQRYINLVTLPSTSLEKLEVIDTKTNNQGKIDMIKFKIGKDEDSK
ncbi:hypothetical protein [Halpernia sp.]|uniref:hypothetical protein n=1 Tax=Halpernia sp. TaxID=2782209 RepID=UPI003A90CF99